MNALGLQQALRANGLTLTARTVARHPAVPELTRGIRYTITGGSIYGRERAAELIVAALGPGAVILRPTGRTDVLVRPAHGPRAHREPLVTALTRTQRAALTELHRRGHLWPAGRGRLANRDARYSRRTLDALAAAGYARWVYTPGIGVTPYVVPTSKEA